MHLKGDCAMCLSKSKYVQVRTCAKAAWISKYHPELIVEDVNTRARIQTGKDVEREARLYFAPFVDVTVLKDDGSLDLSQMLVNTRIEMQKGTSVICEAAFSCDDLYCAVDILCSEEDGWAIYEVKSSSEGMQDKYLADVAFQKYVLEHCGVKVTGVNLVCIDTSYVLSKGGLDRSGFFKIIDLSEQIEEEQLLVPQYLRIAEEVLENRKEPCSVLKEECKDCDFFAYCTKKLPSPNVFDLYRMPMKKKLDFFNQGKIGFDKLQAEKDKLNEIQQRQIDFSIQDRGTYTDREKIQRFLSNLSYPLYFLDFETMQPAIPFCEGTHPFAQIPFQYSLHYIEREGDKLLHKEYLAQSGTDPRRGIAEALCRDIPKNVCVTAYNKSFECTRLKELTDMFPDLAEHLLTIESNIVDLLIPFQKGWYYKKEMGGSFSIKSVLPAICPNDPELDYHKLEDVHNGGEAMSIFPQIQYMKPKEQQRARGNLLKYCELDTKAMVKVWEELCRAAGMR